MIAALVVASTLAGALAWRMRGAALGTTWLSVIPSGLATRTAAALLMVAPLALLVDWRLAWLAAPLWVGMAVLGYGDVLDQGRVDGDQAREGMVMSGWGLVAVAPVVAALWWQGLTWWPMLVAGLAFGPVYSAAWHAAPDLPDVPGLAAGPTEWAEVLLGALLGAALAAAAVL